MFIKQINYSLILCYIFVSLCSADYLSLDGDDWTASNGYKTHSLPFHELTPIKVKASVPGSIYTDLRREGVLKEDLYLGNNDINYRWVSYENWTYERTFNVNPTILSKQKVDLVLEGVDTISTVYVNDQIIGQTDNQFVRYKFDLKKVLKSGQNSIRIAFQSAPIHAKQRAAEYLSKYHYSVVPDCNPDQYHGECHFNFIRKMASSFSWDWGPAFPTQGIWKSIGIEAHNQSIIRDITVETEHGETHWTLAVGMFIELPDLDKSKRVLTNMMIINIKLDGQPILVNSKQEIATNQVNKTIKWTFIIPITGIPIISWFPNGVANNTQKLYELSVNLTFDDSSEVSTVTKKIGFRTIELVQEPIKPEGLSFYFRVNGVPFFAKGTNWIPAHVLMEELTPEYLRHLLTSAKKANMNMMRVWGGGVYESDLFYELADELGIMIWQDFMFACALYPSNEDFLKSVDSEIITQVRRLQHHPSIAIWAGNNENELGLANWWLHLPQYKDDYYKLYVSNIKNIVDSEDSSRPFVSSSPSNGLESIQENYTAYNPGDTRYGDVHYYNDNGVLWNFKTYPSAKFASEYGFQSYPSLETITQAIPVNNLTYPISEAIEHRQHHPEGTAAIENQISNYLKLPSKGGAERFNDLIYLSQITQAMAMKTETEFYRRNREIDPKTGDGYTMGALYWQLNDIWQAPTWASIEFGGKWKVLQSYARSFLDNHLISPFEDPYNTLKVSLVRDDYSGQLSFNYTIKVYKWSKTSPVNQITGQTKTDSFSANIIYTNSVSDLLNRSNCVDRTECVLSFEISNSDHNIRADNFMLLTEPKNSRLVAPNLKLVDVKQTSTLENQTQKFKITLSSESVAPFVLLDFKLNSGLKGQFLENGFFIFDGKKTIVFETNHNLTENQIKDNLIFKTLTDVV